MTTEQIEAEIAARMEMLERERTAKRQAAPLKEWPRYDLEMKVVALQARLDEAERLLRMVAGRYEYEQAHIVEFDLPRNGDGTPRTWLHIDHPLGQAARAFLKGGTNG